MISFYQVELFKSVLFGFYQVMLCIPFEMWSYSSISLFLSVLLPSLLWPCMFLFYPFSYPSLYHSYPLYHSIHPFLLIAFPHNTALFYLPSLPSFYLLSLIPSHPPANFPTVPFPTSSFLSISPLIYLSCWAPTRSDASPCVYAACVLFVSPTCHSVTHCFV